MCPDTARERNRLVDEPNSTPRSGWKRHATSSTKTRIVLRSIIVSLSVGLRDDCRLHDCGSVADWPQLSWLAVITVSLIDLVTLHVTTERRFQWPAGTGAIHVLAVNGRGLLRPPPVTTILPETISADGASNFSGIVPTTCHRSDLESYSSKSFMTPRGGCELLQRPPTIKMRP